MLMSCSRFVGHKFSRVLGLTKSRNLNDGMPSHPSLMVVNRQIIDLSLTREQVDRLVLSSRRGAWYPRRQSLRHFR